MNQQKVETTCRDMTSYNCTDIPWTETVRVPVQKTRIVPQTRSQCQNIRVPVRDHYIKILEYYFQSECITKNWLLGRLCQCFQKFLDYPPYRRFKFMDVQFFLRVVSITPHLMIIDCFYYFLGRGRDSANSHHPNRVQGTVLQHALNSLLNRSSMWTTASTTKMPIQPGTF